MNLKNVDTHALAAELARRQRTVRKLAARRQRLAKELARVDAELEALGQAAPARAGKAPAPRQRARNDVSLADALAAAMEVRAVVSPSEAATLVRRNGYKSTARNFGMLVSNALSKDQRFKRVARGQYERVA
jgi:hypothetical protein